MPMPDAPAKLILPKPRPETPPEQVLPPFATRHRKLLRVLRLLFGLAVMAVMLWGFLNYDIYKVPGENGGGKVFGVGRGDTLLMARYRFWREPRLGDVVFYRAPGSTDDAAAQLGRVVGLPGEKVERQGPTMRVGGRDALAVGFELGPKARIKHGDVIPEGRYLVLVDSDALEYSDSREFGYVPAENVVYRLAMNFSDWGRK